MKKVLMILGLMVVFGIGAYAQDVPAQVSAETEVQAVENKADVEEVNLLNVVTTIGILVTDEKIEDAYEKCNEALVKYPDAPELYYWRGVVLSAKGKHLEALADYEKAIALKPDNLDYHVRRGMCMSDLGNRTGAMDEFDYVINKDPKMGMAYLMRAVIKLQMGDYSGASADLEKGNLYVDEELTEIDKDLEELENGSVK